MYWSVDGTWSFKLDSFQFVYKLNNKQTSCFININKWKFAINSALPAPNLISYKKKNIYIGYINKNIYKSSKSQCRTSGCLFYKSKLNNSNGKF